MLRAEHESPPLSSYTATPSPPPHPLLPASKLYPYLKTVTLSVFWVALSSQAPPGSNGEVSRLPALGVAVVDDAQVARLAAEGGLLYGEHGHAAVAAGADQHEAVCCCCGQKVRRGGGGGIVFVSRGAIVL